MVTDAEVQQYYENNSVEYEWLRERESVRGTKPEMIEMREREQIRRDLQDPRQREAVDKQQVYLDVLREKANIEYLK
jgi:hypothetical protein